MNHELTPQREEIARKASERIRESIARLVFKATEMLEPGEEVTNPVEGGEL